MTVASRERTVVWSMTRLDEDCLVSMELTCRAYYLGKMSVE